MLVRQLELLSKVERLPRSLQLPEDVGYTCELPGTFGCFMSAHAGSNFLLLVLRMQISHHLLKTGVPLKSSSPMHLTQSLQVSHLRKTCGQLKGVFRYLKTMFQELEECRAFELRKSTVDQANHLMRKQAKIVAMTCTHAALMSKDFLQLGFKYDNLLMEESAEILEIGTLIPMLLQRQEDGYTRLKQYILIGDYHQLPPVLKNVAFQKYSHMDPCLFTRFVRLGIPYIELNAQGRGWPSIAKLYNCRYRDLGDLAYIKEAVIFHGANARFLYGYQLVDVPDYWGKGESAPRIGSTNEGETEYIVSVYIYMRLLGYPANNISILTTYNE